MTTFRAFLVLFLVALTVYTVIVIMDHGLNLFAVFIGDMMQLNWAGQFNADFMGFLMLSALWTAWRNQFTPQGLGLAVVAFFGGMVFLSIYLLYLSAQTNGNAVEMLVGDRA